MEGTTCEWRTSTLPPTKPSYWLILVKLLRGGSASQQGSLLHRTGEDRGSRTGQGEEGDRVGGLVAGLRRRTGRGFLVRKSTGLTKRASRTSVCGRIRGGRGG